NTGRRKERLSGLPSEQLVTGDVAQPRLLRMLRERTKNSSETFRDFRVTALGCAGWSVKIKHAAGQPVASFGQSVASFTHFFGQVSSTIRQALEPNGVPRWHAGKFLDAKRERLRRRFDGANRRSGLSQKSKHPRG